MMSSEPFQAVSQYASLTSHVRAASALVLASTTSASALGGVTLANGTFPALVLKNLQTRVTAHTLYNLSSDTRLVNEGVQVVEFESKSTSKSSSASASAEAQVFSASASTLREIERLAERIREGTGEELARRSSAYAVALAMSRTAAPEDAVALARSLLLAAALGGGTSGGVGGGGNGGGASASSSSYYYFGPPPDNAEERPPSPSSAAPGITVRSIARARIVASRAVLSEWEAM